MATLRDDLAAVLGPGNNDQIAYDQADAVLDVLHTYGILAITTEDVVTATDALLFVEMNGGGSLVRRLRDLAHRLEG